MLINIKNKGVTNNGYADMSVTIKKERKDNIPITVYFISVLEALNDTDPNAFMNALEAFFKSEMEKYNDEE